MAAKDTVDEVLGQLFDGTDPRVRIVGIGGAGTNVVTALTARELQGMETVVVSAEPSGLERVHADRGFALGLPAGASADEVADAVETHSAELRESLEAEIVFAVAGLGGSTGTGGLPGVCRLAREGGAVVLAIAILPFKVEATRRAFAERAVEALRGACDSVLVVDNESLVKFGGAASLKDSFGLVNRMVGTLVTRVREQVKTDFLSTLAEEVEIVAHDMEQETNHEVDVSVISPPEVVEARAEMNPVAFDSGGFLGWR